MKRFAFVCFPVCLLLFFSAPVVFAAGSAAPSPSANAQAPQAVKPAPDKPEKGVDRVTVVTVQHEGSDSIGANLAMRLKERFNQSNLFTLNDDEEKDIPKLRLLISTEPEFPGRPNVGSIYSACWVFSQGKGYLGYLLSRDLGAATADDISALVNRLAERTDGIAARYSSLWK
ncbi:MAG: conserved hypothetical protein [Candidatus Desulfovibrio kirbyi]|uniref:Uncharacterized protein n=1 Tax=Candidatus Desulfovibrio kirbyi TaxID=2696086 RepID=A0A6L2R4Y0_9BACT|nr:MAG: conserved hypothetical protein [Candidatus Desulfovibrio kirbyi]